MVGISWAPVEGEPTSGPARRFSIAIEAGSIDLGGVVEFVEFEPPHELAWTNITGHRPAWPLGPAGPRRQDAGDAASELPGPGGVLALVASKLGKPIIRRDVRRSLEALKEIVEGGPR